MSSKPANLKVQLKLPQPKKENYIDPIPYHEEMVRCKKAGTLSPKAIAFFQLHAKEVSKMFYFEFKEDREDAISNAVKDFLCYWKNFKESNVTQINIIRNFVPGEQFIINVYGDKTYSYTSSSEPSNDFEFLIGTTENKSLENLDRAVKKTIPHLIQSSLHKVTQKINLMDIMNGADQTKQSILEIKLVSDKILVKDEKKYEKSKIWKFKTPPDSFKFYTSLARNAMIKHINDHHPEEIRDGKLMFFSRINSNSEDRGGLFNI